MTNEPYLATTDQDKDTITALHTLCFDPKTQGLPLQVALDDKNCFAFLAPHRGYNVCRIQDKESELLWIGVRPDRQGEGWARSLTTIGMNESHARGAEIMSLYVAEDNDSAIHLYKSLGFVTVGRLDGFYANVSYGSPDANIMRASLIKNENQENGSQKDEPYLATTDQDKDAITALHLLCFGSEEQLKLQVALDDKNCFALLAGCDENEQPTGYTVVHVQDNWAKGLWYGVRADRLYLKRNRSRKKGLGRTLMLAGINEARARGAEYLDTYVLADNRASAITLSMHKKEGFVPVDSFLDYRIVDGKRIECTNHHLRMSLITGK